MAKKKQTKISGGPVSRFIQHHYRHFNAASLVDAAKGSGTVFSIAHRSNPNKAKANAPEPLLGLPSHA